MDWYYLLISLLIAYGLIASILYIRRPLGDRITFYGPIMAIRSYNVGFFDRFTRFGSFFRVYGSIGVLMVAIISILMSLLLIFSLRYTLLFQPEPIGIYEPQNILLLPGINDYVPSTLAVWFAFFLTIGIHELGHGILCRVEGIRVKSVGILVAIIPIGFFVEPDEDDLQKAARVPKARMFGAGIINNLAIGLICFLALISVLGMIAAPTAPVIHGIYKGYPAYEAGIPSNSIIREINGQSVRTPMDVASLLNNTRPGDRITLLVEHEGISKTYSLTLSAWPQEMVPVRESGFMGVYYYPSDEVTARIADALRTPQGFLYLLTLPFDSSSTGQYLRMLAFDTVEISYFTVPFTQFWTLVHLLFWCGWINLNVGIFNAIPMVPLDGGYIMKEGLEGMLKRRGWERFTDKVVMTVSWVMLFLMVSLIALPYLLHI